MKLRDAEKRPTCGRSRPASKSHSEKFPRKKEAIPTDKRKIGPASATRTGLSHIAATRKSGTRSARTNRNDVLSMMEKMKNMFQALMEVTTPQKVENEYNKNKKGRRN